MDRELLCELRVLGPVTGSGTAVGVDAPAVAVRAVVGHRAQVLTGDARRRADPAADADHEALVTVNTLPGSAGQGGAAFVSVFVVADRDARTGEHGRVRTPHRGRGGPGPGHRRAGGFAARLGGDGDRGQGHGSPRPGPGGANWSPPAPT
ncbi:hypothetical protein [Streptomyces sp. NPDC088348]|uniref:hypothetical protein n=1 Tax=Streptomyces sp. NPDC088348 TaxID=3365853 RepID=UPI00381774EE